MRPQGSLLLYSPSLSLRAVELCPFLYRASGCAVDPRADPISPGSVLLWERRPCTLPLAYFPTSFTKEALGLGCPVGSLAGVGVTLRRDGSALSLSFP